MIRIFRLKVLDRIYWFRFISRIWKISTFENTIRYLEKISRINFGPLIKSSASDIQSLYKNMRDSKILFLFNFSNGKISFFHSLKIYYFIEKPRNNLLLAAKLSLRPFLKDSQQFFISKMTPWRQIKVNFKVSWGR